MTSGFLRIWRLIIRPGSTQRQSSLRQPEAIVWHATTVCPCIHQQTNIYKYIFRAHCKHVNSDLLVGDLGHIDHK
jgi:hypothetical protein